MSKDRLRRGGQRTFERKPDSGNKWRKGVRELLEREEVRLFKRVLEDSFEGFLREFLIRD